MRKPSVSLLRSRVVRDDAGFTLIELMITLVVLAVVAIALVAVMYSSQRGKSATTNAVESAQSARAAMEMIARDLRSAGYNADPNTGNPQPAIAYIDSTQVLMNEDLMPYPDTVTVGGQPKLGIPLAYAPTGSPKPYPLDGTSWAPGMRYITGAEVVRYTLDVNNDGVVDANDQSAPEGVDAQRTRNPNDYTLVRQVYGDSTGGSAGNNGGTTQRVALLQAPGGSVPPLFRVYMRGLSTPYDWSSGPVPPSQLQNIERIDVSVTSASPKPDWLGRYSTTTLSTTVNSMRNTPVFGQSTYLVDGYVFHDNVVQDGTRQAGEPGVGAQLVRLGNVYTCYTSPTGYFSFHAPAGTYVLRNYSALPWGPYGSAAYTITVPPAVQRSFADTMAAGGWVHVLAFQDANGSGTRDAGEPGVQAVRVTLSTGASGYTDGYGMDSLFTGVGSYAVSVSPPDSFVVSGTNPQSGTMVNGGSASHTFALVANSTGTVKGTVYRDNNRNATLDGGEPGIPDVWVGVTKNGGIDVDGWSRTDANGQYSITVPINDPPHTTAYSVYCIPPNSYFPTSPIALGNIWITSGATISNKNFGMAAFQIITLNASRVLSLASGDLIEGDWNGNHTENAHGDADIVLGADAGVTQNISVWFNQYPTSPVFTSTPSYSRTAPEAVLSLALDTLDTSDPVGRPDVVTATKKTAYGNFFVWLNQNSNNNEGILASTFSPGLNYSTQDGGDATAVVTDDCSGNNMPDLIVGTRSPSAGRGSFEVWQNSGGTSPTFSRQEVYPPAGNIPGGSIGEVTCMALADLDNDGFRDLVVGTRTGTYSGSLEIFRFVSKNNGSRFIHYGSFSVPANAVTAVCCLDVDGDGLRDVVCGVQSASNKGQLQYWKNTGLSGSSYVFVLTRVVDTPGLVTSLVAADFGGSTRKDIAMGWRQDETSYVGGCLIYFTDLGSLPSGGVDPSAGAVTNFVPALTTNNFNYGVIPAPPSPPYLTDLAAGVKTSLTTGAVWVFIR